MFLQNPQFYWVGGYPFSIPVPLESKRFGLLSGIMSGVYALFYRSLLTGSLELRYIGQADSLGNRVNFSHHAVQQMLKEPGCSTSQIYVAYHYVDTKAKRDQIEQELIHKLQPRYNIQHTGMGSFLRFLAENHQKRLY